MLAVVFGRLRDVAGFVAFDAGGLLDERGVPGFAEAGRLRELRGGDGVAAAAAALHDSVNALGAAEAGNAETRHGGVGAEAVDLLVERHEREEIVDAFFCGEAGVAEGVVLGLLGGEFCCEG